MAAASGLAFWATWVIWMGWTQSACTSFRARRITGHLLMLFLSELTWLHLLNFLHWLFSEGYGVGRAKKGSLESLGLGSRAVCRVNIQQTFWIAFHFQARKFITGLLLIGIAYEMHSPVILASPCCSLTSIQVDGVQLKRMKGAQRQHEWWNLSFTASPVIKEDSDSFFGGIGYTICRYADAWDVATSAHDSKTVFPCTFKLSGRHCRECSQKRGCRGDQRVQAWFFLMANFHQWSLSFDHFTEQDDAQPGEQNDAAAPPDVFSDGFPGRGCALLERDPVMRL